MLFLAPFDLARAVFTRSNAEATEAAVGWTADAVERVDPGAAAMLVASWLVVARSTGFLFACMGGGGMLCDNQDGAAVRLGGDGSAMLISVEDRSLHLGEQPWWERELHVVARRHVDLFPGAPVFADGDSWKR